MNADLRVSIVVVDYNYGRFLGAAIDSALAQSWRNIEVIVVDDGSTDDSADVIARYGDRIKAFRKENGGQASVYNYGFARTTGQLVIFLDADDVLYADCAATLAAHWRPGVSKIQARLDTIDGEGRNLDLQFPHYSAALSPAEIKRQLFQFGGYIYAPASGNAFDRDYLAKSVPIPSEFRYNADGFLSTLAPLYGDVAVANAIVAGYRVHGENSWAQAAVSAAKYALHIGYDLALRGAFIDEAQRLGYDVDARSLLWPRNHIESRLFSRRLAPSEHPVADDSIANLVKLGVRSIWADRNLNLGGKALWSVWVSLIGMLPPPIVRSLLQRFRLQSFRAPLARKLVAWSRAPAAEPVGPLSAPVGEIGEQEVSIVIVNHNYGRFLREAIESALGQTHRDVEVVVVDDGSTDESPDIIATFGDRVKSVIKRNGGHTSAVNEGFAASTGELAIFLDADDRLHPRSVETVLANWRRGAAKVQYRLNTIDRDGRDLNMPFPHYVQRLRDDPEEARREVLAVGSYSYPVSSGNAFSRAFLSRVLPIDPAFYRAPDGLLNRLAPLYGPVIALPDILADYRVHGANVLAQKHLEPRKFAANVRYEIEREAYFRDRAHLFGYSISDDILLKNKSHIETRLLSLRLSDDHPVAADKALHLARLGVKSAFAARDLRFIGRFVWSVWFLALALLPMGVVSLLARSFRLQTKRAPVANALISLSRLSAVLLCVTLGILDRRLI